jgi:hypothetical protein
MLCERLLRPYLPPSRHGFLGLGSCRNATQQKGLVWVGLDPPSRSIRERDSEGAREGTNGGSGAGTKKRTGTSKTEQSSFVVTT